MKSWHTLVLYWMMWVDIKRIKNAHVFCLCILCSFVPVDFIVFFISITLLSPTENDDFITNFATQNHQTSKDILSTKGKRTIYSVPCRGYVFRIMALGDNYPCDDIVIIALHGLRQKTLYTIVCLNAMHSVPCHEGYIAQSRGVLLPVQCCYLKCDIFCLKLYQCNERLVSDVKECFRTMASLARLFVIRNPSNVIDGRREV